MMRSMSRNRYFTTAIVNAAGIVIVASRAAQSGAHGSDPRSRGSTYRNAYGVTPIVIPQSTHLL